MHASWSPIQPDDQYSEPGDSLYYEGRYWLYFWNPIRMVVRRYGLDEEYQEVRVRKLPSITSGFHYLSVRLSMYFAQAKKKGTLLIDQPEAST